MFRRLRTDESGIAMGLAVIVVVLVGVMGAGLLVFVRSDLNAVIQVNQGQRAFETADAGVQAAKLQLLTDAAGDSYDGEDDDSEWSFSNGGEQLSFDGNDVNVQIRYLPPVEEPDEPNENQAPEVIQSGEDELPEGRRYFKITATGSAGEARRKAEAIYHTVDLDLPKSYFATRDVTMGGNSVSITDTSIFAKGNINGLREDTLQGEDREYGNWDDPPWNENPRTTTDAGAAAEGVINYNPGSYGGEDRDGITDFDSESTPEFTDNVWAQTDPPGTQPSGTISYPFDPSRDVDLDFLRDVASAQGNYYSQAEDGFNNNFAIGDSGSRAYPNPSNESSVYFVEFAGSKGNATFRAEENEEGELPKGTIVVVNGDVDTSSSVDGYQGVIIVRDPEDVGLMYENKGNFTLNGFVNIDGEMVLRGSVNPLVSEEVLNRPGFYGLELWSWREMYE